MLHYVKFVTGTPDEFKHLRYKESDTLYFIYKPEDNQATLYLGNKIISDGNINNNGINSIASLQDVIINDDLKHSDILVYDNILQSWTNKTYLDILNIFIGTNGVSAGIAGLVPAPAPDQENTFLKSDGSWSSLDDNVEETVIHTINNSSIPLEELDKILT